MRIIFLGTGAAGGVPRYGCACPACQRAQQNPVFERRPCSVLVEDGDTRVILDAGLMNLHQRFPLGSFTAFVLTHFHPDHVQGLFHLRWGVLPDVEEDTSTSGSKSVDHLPGNVPVFCPPDSEGCADLFKHPGILDFKPQVKFQAFQVGSLSFTPLPLIHSKVTFGYLIENSAGVRFAYLTDTVGLPPKTLKLLQQLKPHGLAMDATDPSRGMVNTTGNIGCTSKAANHNDWQQALDLIQAIRPDRAWLTHIGHRSDAWQIEHQPVLPPGVAVACDNSIINLQS